LVPKSVILNGVMAIAMRYYTEFSTFPDASHKSGRRYNDTFFSRNVAQRI